MNLSVSVQEEDFSLQTEYQKLFEQDKFSGAIVTFVGRVRDVATDKKILGLQIEHYPGMTESALESILQQAALRFSINAARIVHRIGRINSYEQIVFVGVTSVHREEAFSATEFIMDYLKTHAPFWKKEITGAGDIWVESKAKDQQRFDRWNKDR